MNQSQMIRVLVVEDREIVRDGICAIANLRNRIIVQSNNSGIVSNRTIRL